MDNDTIAILEAVNFIKDRMVTKDDLLEFKQDVGSRFEIVDRRFQAIDRRFDAIDQRFDSVENRLSNIETELRDIRKHIEALEEAARNSTGFAKEIDHLLERIAAVERHLGLKHEVAA